jgi:hypothetical protein
MLLTLITVIFLTAFLTASVAVGVGAFLLESRRFGHATTGATGAPAGFETPLLLREDPLSTISIWRQLLARFDFFNILRLRIAEAGLRWSVGRVTLMILLVASLSTSLLLVLDWAPVVTVPCGRRGVGSGSISFCSQEAQGAFSAHRGAISGCA